MADSSHLEILAQGVANWNRWREGRSEITADLSAANLHGRDLNHSALAGVNLAGADLAWANLVDANLVGANLHRADLRVARLSRADLRQAHGVRCWYFPEDASIGKPVWDEIDRATKVYDRLIVICSANSLRSGPVLREIERALQREDSERRNDILFPVRIDDYVFKNWQHCRKPDVIAKVVGDFSGWNTDERKYETELIRILTCLQSRA